MLSFLCCNEIILARSNLIPTVLQCHLILQSQLSFPFNKRYSLILSFVLVMTCSTMQVRGVGGRGGSGFLGKKIMSVVRKSWGNRFFLFWVKSFKSYPPSLPPPFVCNDAYVVHGEQTCKLNLNLISRFFSSPWESSTCQEVSSSFSFSSGSQKSGRW